MQQLAPRRDESSTRLTLDDGSAVAVIGGGPAGSFFSYFLLRMAESIGTSLKVDIFEPRHFTESGPAGCNHCGGIISESLVQILAAEGINLPPAVVQRGIDSYVLHMDVGTVRIKTPLEEKRIAAVSRGAGPLELTQLDWKSFDDYLLDLAVAKGAQIVRKLVSDVDWSDGLPNLKGPGGPLGHYDLVAVATGINSNFLEVLENLDFGYKPPQGSKTYICEFQMSKDTIQQYLGTSMHVFLLDIPRLKFAALIPKGNYATMCLLGKDIDNDLLQSFLNAPAVRECFPLQMDLGQNVCYCFPRINMKRAIQPYADRMVMLGDSGVTRLYKDGIGAAYRTAKAAATTAVFQGVSKEDFRKHYWPACRLIANDNIIGKMIFAANGLCQKRAFTRRAVFRMTALEQEKEGGLRPMSGVLWDLFTGSAPYRDVLFRALSFSFMSSFLWNLAFGLWPWNKIRTTRGNSHE